MKEGRNKVRAKNFKKGSELRKRGFKTAIHALPAKVRAEIDQSLISGISPDATLKNLSIKYPKIKFPSRIAVNNYRKKYLKIDASHIPVTEERQEYNQEKLRIEKHMGETISKLVTVIIPKMVDVLDKSVDREVKTSLPFPTNDKRLDIITRAMKEFNVWADRNGIKLYQSETTTEILEGDDEEGKEVNWDDVLAETINRSRTQIKVRTTRKVAIAQK